MKSLIVALGVVVMFICLEMTLAADLGEQCGIKSQCPDDVDIICKIYEGCTNGTCQCKPDYVADGQACKMSKTYDEDCGDNDKCTGPANVCTNGKCACPADHVWDDKKANCFMSATTYEPIGDECTAIGDCTSRDSANADAYVCEAAEGQTTPTNCGCADTYEHDAATDTCAMPVAEKKGYDIECVVADNDCHETTVCRAVSTDDQTLKCLCPVDDKKWNARAMMCVDNDDKVDQAQDAVCTLDTGIECATDLECLTCPETATGDKHCRAVDTSAGSGDTSGAAQVAAGFVTLILSAVAMML